MTDMDVLYVSEESRQKISEIRSSPTSLSFGKYRIQIEPGLLRYFLYVWKERDAQEYVRVVPMDATDLCPGDLTYDEARDIMMFNGCFWVRLCKQAFCDIYARTPSPAPKKKKEKYLDEVEVNRDEWLAS